MPHSAGVRATHIKVAIPRRVTTTVPASLQEVMPAQVATKRAPLRIPALALTLTLTPSPTPKPSRSVRCSAVQVQKPRSDLAVVMALAVPALGSVLADPLMSLVRLALTIYNIRKAAQLGSNIAARSQH